MLLFTRTHSADALRGPGAEAGAIQLAERASVGTGLDVIPWAAVYGLPLGTIVHSSRVESQAAAAAALARLADDDEHRRLVAEHGAAHRTARTTDEVGEILAVTGTGELTGGFASVLVARCAPGRIAEATSWGTDVLAHASKVGGLDGAFVRNLYGPSTTLVWILLARTMAEVDASSAALAGDDSYRERVDDGGHLFLPGSPTQRLLRRLV